MSLIVNADDFGRSTQINLDIIKCHQKGIVTSTTLMAGGAKFGEAVCLAKENPKLGIGVHLALDGPFNIGNNYSSIIDPNTKIFYNYNEFHTKRKSFLYTELVSEYSLQIEKVLDSGLKISHLDHHHHIHRYFSILKAVITVAKKYNIKHIRSQKILCGEKMSFIKTMYRSVHQLYVKNRLNTISGYTGFVSQNQNDMRLQFDQMLSQKNTVLDLMVHPSKENGEIEFLTNPDVVALSQDYLINYNDLK